MNNDIKTFINHIFPLSNEVLEDVLSRFEYLEYPKNYHLLKQGRHCRHIWFMTKGLVRYYYTDENGKESNVWFSIGEDVVTIAPSLANQSLSNESIQLLEDSGFFLIDYKNLQNLLQKHHSFALWHINLIEKYYINQIEYRIADLQFLNAKQRYEKLLKRYPSIINRISLGHISSFLNITQETLSRIRANKY